MDMGCPEWDKGRPVPVCSLPNEHDFDDVISKHTQFDVTTDLVTGKHMKNLF